MHTKLRKTDEMLRVNLRPTVECPGSKSRNAVIMKNVH